MATKLSSQDPTWKWQSEVSVEESGKKMVKNVKKTIICHTVEIQNYTDCDVWGL